ncbi:MAG: LacI family transcriptional regulator [Propionibacteriaceae bacterium]|jgi:DNA-binding LacI/PurR family transcriptional regulator|nr:LacI family transcriptional regulator [Propionibacteriaceae bacterium]
MSHQPKPFGHVTMKDVANKAGVSPMTVSNVVSGTVNVRPETRKKVEDAIIATGYKVNAAARHLRQGRSGLLGLAVPGLDQPYFGHVATEISKIASDYGYEVAVERTGNNLDFEIQALRQQWVRAYDGVIISAVALSNAYTTPLIGNEPIVLLGQRDFHTAVDHVSIANEKGGRLATQHLIDRGCRRIVTIGGRISDDDFIDGSSRRTEGYRQALADAGIGFDPNLVTECPLTPDGGYEAIRRLLVDRRDFDGVFATSDLVAMGALRALADNGYDVPGRVKVIGFDNLPTTPYLNPTLSSVAPDYEMMARETIDLLVGRIKGQRQARTHEHVVIPCHVEARVSTSTAFC